MNVPELNARIKVEDRTLRYVADLAASGVAPHDFPQPFRRFFALAIVPFRDSPSLIETRKGLRLLGVFYPGQTTVERIPGWIREEIKTRDRSDERMAERVRADLVKAFWTARERKAAAKREENNG